MSPTLQVVHYERKSPRVTGLITCCALFLSLIELAWTLGLSLFVWLYKLHSPCKIWIYITIVVIVSSSFTGKSLETSSAEWPFGTYFYVISYDFKDV